MPEGQKNIEAFLRLKYHYDAKVDYVKAEADAEKALKEADKAQKAAAKEEANRPKVTE